MVGWKLDQRFRGETLHFRRFAGAQTSVTDWLCWKATFTFPAQGVLIRSRAYRSVFGCVLVTNSLLF